MLNIFYLKNNCLFRVDGNNEVSSVNNVIWIDIIQTNDNDFYKIKSLLDQLNIDFFVLKNIVQSKRFFKNEFGLHIRSFFFTLDNQNQINNAVVSFTIYNGCLYTLREKKFPVFCMYQKTLNNYLLNDGAAYELLLNLFEIKIDDLMDRIEYIYSSLERLGVIIMNGQKIEEYDGALSDLAMLESVGWKIRINLLDTERAIKFLLRQVTLSIAQIQYANQILNDIAVLFPYNECVFQKISFLTQSIMGFINIEQNRIIKIFSIIFLPPTLIASSYGMNFDFMPELKWPFGYPSAIMLMILTGLVPYLYFKYKKWL